MARKALRVLWGVTARPVESLAEETINVMALKSEILCGRWWKRVWRYSDVELITHRWDVTSHPLKVCLVARAMARHSPRVRELATERIININRTVLLQLLRDYLGDRRDRARLLSDCEMQVQLESSRTTVRPILRLKERPMYLRTDLVFGLTSGGSVGHIAGVINNLDAFTGAPCLVTTDNIPTVRDDIEVHLIPCASRFREFRDLPSLYNNTGSLATARRTAGDRPVSFVYQRYSIFNFTGVQVSRWAGVPFVLEYNGSEVWVAANWGTGLKHPDLAERIEMLNLQAAHLIVVVSQPLKDDLISRGIDANKILVNPNGVEPQRYSPEITGDDIRSKWNLLGKTVVGFIGTFEPFHGAAVLADAYGRLLERRPDLRDTTRLLLVGDGQQMAEVTRQIARHGISTGTVLTGTVPQQMGPAHLAAMDVLVSPHVPNPDGTRFFGSPTKLFEYMAMGRGIVASNLEQIGDVLRHNETAWLVEAGDCDDLSRGIECLIDHPDLRARLGQNARNDALRRFTWREHTRRVVDSLVEHCQ